MTLPGDCCSGRPLFSERTNMLKAAGITAEYNPLHNGHIYHIEETRRITGCDAVVVAMSGDFVQRGEPAIIDKWVRTENALSSGADLVLEIPALFCLSNAGQYAEAAVRILEATGRVSHVSFGSESGDSDALIRIARSFKERNDEIEATIRADREKGLSYPAARMQAYAYVMAALNGTDEDDPLITRDLRILEKPNDILALEYIKALESAEPVIIPRQGAGYGEAYTEGASFQSASAIRTKALEEYDVSVHVPESTADALKNSHLTGPDKDGWFDMLRYAVLSSGIDTIEDCPSGGEGLASLLKTCAVSASTWSEFISCIKSKRYTYTRISRLCVQLLLGISRSKYNMSKPEYIRVLGFNSTGRKLLAEMRDNETASLPVIINVNKAGADLNENAAKLLELDMHAADIYNLITKGEIGQHSDRRRLPVIMK